MPVIWPEDTSWDPSDEAVRLPDGDIAPLGSRVTGGGGYSSSLDGIVDQCGHDVADAAERCHGDTGEVALSNRVPGRQAGSARGCRENRPCQNVSDACHQGDYKVVTNDNRTST